MEPPRIDTAFGVLDIANERTINTERLSVSVVIPAHNEEETVAQVISDAYAGLSLLPVQGDVTVSASGCTDQTVERAKKAGATVVEAPTGKGNALSAGIAATSGDIICLIDGDLQYFGDPPLSALLTQPILNGIADATISDLYWRPLYPNMWQCGFFVPAAGFLLPEILPKVGSTPWSGQRAALRHLWPDELPGDYKVDLHLLLHWNQHAERLRPLVADDWTNPQRPKPELMIADSKLLIDHAVEKGRIPEARRDAFSEWTEKVHECMAQYRHGVHDPQEFEHALLVQSIEELHRLML